MNKGLYTKGYALVWWQGTLGVMMACASCLAEPPESGLASWYGETHRGKLMANGKPFDPDKLTAASWYYPFGTKVRVSTTTGEGETRSVLVTITDRGPTRKHVENGRIIDLGRAAFERLADPDVGLVRVSVETVP